jgi:hypothetical protein
VICISAIQKLLGMLTVKLESLGLDVGFKGTAQPGAFVEIYAQLVKGGNKVFHRTFHLAALIGIFDAQDEFAALAAGKEKIVKSGSQTANVQITCGLGAKRTLTDSS